MVDDSDDSQLFDKFRGTLGKDDKSEKSKTTNKDDDSPSPPAYHPLDKAADVFDNIYFYGSEDYLQLGREARAAVLQDMTVQDVYLKYTAERGNNGLYELIIALRGILQDPVIKYLAPAKLSVEERLAALTTIDLSGAQEVALFQSRRPSDIPTADDIWTTTSTKLDTRHEKKRSLPLGFVLGPSGSGKTFFALQYLSPKLLVDKAMETKRVTIYLQAMDAYLKFNDETGEEAASALFAWIKDKIRRDTKIFIPENQPLEMHVCLIIDEAGVANVKKWFENGMMVRALCAEAKKMATSVAVVVSGTGLTAHAVSSMDDAYVFRMRQWQEGDLAMILEKYATTLKLDQGEATSRTLAKAIFAHPKLGALATNARSAYFLVKGVARHSQYYNLCSWNSHLDEWTNTLVMEVVHQYIASNGVSSLSKESQRRVAASMFRGLRNLKKNEMKLPDLVEIEPGEITIAESLLQYNFELVDGRLRMVAGESFAVTVTPAIVIVLFAMVGVPATVTPGWRAEEELAALYVVQQRAINCMDKYISEGACDKGIIELDRSLAQIRVISLQQQVKCAKSKDANIKVPRVGADAVLLNADMAPFADVIARFLLIQAKREKSLSGTVNLRVETEKCGLLKSSNRDTRVLQGLLAMWNGHLEPQLDKVQNRGLLQKSTHQEHQASIAFPANLLSLVPHCDPQSYAVIEKNDIVVGDVKSPLPSWDAGTTITFMISTNMTTLRLNISSTQKPQKPIKITEDNLDADLGIKVETLTDSDRLAWTRFMQNEVREGVVIKFLLTKST